MLLDRVSPVKRVKTVDRWRSPVANILVFLASIGLLSWSWQFVRSRSVAVFSVDAVVNGRVTELKSPAAGQLSQLSIQTGMAVSQGKPIFSVTSDRDNQLPLQAITSRINQHQSDLVRAQARLNRQAVTVPQLAVDDGQQQLLEVSSFDREIEQIQADRLGAQSRIELAQQNVERFTSLQTAGAIPKATLDTAQIELRQRQSEMQSLIARLKGVEVKRQAALKGLSLSKTRSNYDPRIRLEEMQVQMADAQNEVATISQRLRDAEAELAVAQKDSNRQQSFAVKAPSQGIVWQLTAQEGQYVQRGESIGKIADCRDRWVDAVVDEGAVKSLQVGLPAEISLYGVVTDAPKVTGKIAMIRSGIGRGVLGEDITSPASPNTARYSQIRITLDPTQTTPTTAGNLCYLGYTGRVTFQTPSKPNPVTGLLNQLPMFNRISSNFR